MSFLRRSPLWTTSFVMPLVLAGAAGCGPNARDDGNDAVDADTTDGGPCTPGELVCSGNDVYECDADGNPGDLVEACVSPRTCNEGACVDDGGCSDEAKLIYVVDNSNRLLSFDPNVLEAGGDPFTQLGTLDCPCLLYTSPSPRDRTRSRMPSSA